MAIAFNRIGIDHPCRHRFTRWTQISNKLLFNLKASNICPPLDSTLIAWVLARGPNAVSRSGVYSSLEACLDLSHAYDDATSKTRPIHSVWREGEEHALPFTHSTLACHPSPAVLPTYCRLSFHPSVVLDSCLTHGYLVAQAWVMRGRAMVYGL